MSKFTHLHVHTEYSLLDGASRVSELCVRARERGMDAVAMTDHGVMYGAVEFYRAAKDAGIKPIIGCEMYVAADMHDKSSVAREYAHLILLCKDNEGYGNLIKLVSRAFTEGYYYKPRIDYDTLAQFTDGLICTSACLAGDIPQYIMKNRPDAARALAERLHGMFGEDFYLEVQSNGITEQTLVNNELVKMSRELNIPLVATNDVHYIDKEDALPQDVLMCIQTARYMDETDRMKFPTDEFWLKPPEEMEVQFADIPGAIANTQVIADKCNVTFEFGKTLLPSYDVPGGEDHAAYLKKLCADGLCSRCGTAAAELYERLDYELSVIDRMGFTDYFLIVWDFVHFAKSHGIAVGPGRGSAAGSLTAYCLDITGVDPIKYGLLFERFLNPERISMPDIDIDFCMERREEVIEYVKQKYGSDRVAQIITFGTLGARQVLRDVARVMRLPVADADRIAKMMPDALKMTIDRALEQNPKLKAEYDTKPEIKEIIDIARRLEGLPRHASVHAAGVVISKLPVSEYVPLTVNPKDGSVVTQFPMGDLEQLGLLKMDFLGLRNLTVIQHAVRMIEEDIGDVIDIDNMTFDDPATYELIASGDTDGVFQLESPGMRQLMAQLRPQNLNDIMDGISLFRPGPMEFIPAYLEARKNPASIKYKHPLLLPILEPTYGAIIYQEQVMEIVRSLAGYSMGRSDLVRRAMAKKKAAVMDAERNVFINGEERDGSVTVEGAVRRGVPASTAREIFEQMTDFAAYAFNKSHACGYAAVAYYTAYLKRHYPLQFLTALMNSYLSFADKVSAYMQYARQSGITILSPDINRSMTQFAVEDGAIRFGLSAIRDVGEKAVNDIIAERSKGEFKSFFDFLRRTCSSLNKRMLEGLVLSGCFDSMGAYRSQLFAIYDKALDSANAQRRNQASGQVSLFDIGGDTGLTFEIPLPSIQEFRERHMLDMEKRAVGVYLSGHPLNELASVLEKSADNVGSIKEGHDSDEQREYYDGRVVTLIGIISDVKRTFTRQKKQMAKLTFEDLYGMIGVIVFPQTFSRCDEVLTDDAILRIRAKVDMSGDEPQLILEAAEPFSGDEAKYVGKTLYVRIPKSDPQGLFGLKALIARYPGTSTFVLQNDVDGTKSRVGGPFTVKINDGFIAALCEKYGAGNVVVK